MSPRGRRDAGRPLVVDPVTSARLGRIRQSGTAPELQVRELLRGNQPGPDVWRG